MPQSASRAAGAALRRGTTRLLVFSCHSDCALFVDSDIMLSTPGTVFHAELLLEPASFILQIGNRH